MQRALAFLAIVAAFLVGVTQFLLPGIAEQATDVRPGLAGSIISIDPFSFGVGAVAGATAVILVRLPWSELPGMFADIFRIWRRYMVLTTLASVCMGVLLFY